MEQFEGVLNWEWEDSVLIKDDDYKDCCFIVGELEKYHGKKIRVTIEEVE